VRRVEQQERKKQGVQQQLPLVEAAEQVDVLVPAGVENVNKGSAFSQAEHVICADDPQPTP
jgi:U3 small nucleolar RNA-associated protein 14